jgi:hypothetical protein
VDVDRGVPVGYPTFCIGKIFVGEEEITGGVTWETHLHDKKTLKTLVPYAPPPQPAILYHLEPSREPPALSKGQFSISLCISES